MSGNSINPYASPWPMAVAGRPLARGKSDADRLTLTGLLLWLIGATIVLSGYKEYRPTIFGLHFQPYLAPLALGAILMLPTRFQRIPLLPIACMGIFVIFYAFSMVGAPAVFDWMDPKDEIIKIIASLLTILTVALLVRSRADFVFGVAGLCLGVMLLAGRGLQDDDAANRVIDSANKNSYSLYALPAVMLALFLAARVDWKQVSFKRFLTVCCLGASLVISYVMLKGANRSGYVGLAAILLGIAAYIFRSKTIGKLAKTRALLLMLSVASLAVGSLVYFKSTEAFERRFDQTVNFNESDRLRIDLIENSIKIGLEYPVLGYGPQRLPKELARRIPGNSLELTESHNVFAHVFAGSGVFCFLALIATGVTLWYLRPRAKFNVYSDTFYEARWMLRLMLALWALRGLFSREILYIPGFSIGLGLTIGLCLFESGVRPKVVPLGVPGPGTLSPVGSKP